MTMAKRLSEAELRARALARWETEGGALAPTGAADSIDDLELRILARLGAALLEEWRQLPSGLQRSLAERAAKLGAPGDHAHVRENLVRFLSDHRDQC